MFKIVLRVKDTISAPARGVVVAAVEVISGAPKVGCRLTDHQSTATWEIVGFGQSPPSNRLDQYICDINFKLVEGQQELAKGVLLSEQPRPVQKI